MKGLLEVLVIVAAVIIAVTILLATFVWRLLKAAMKRINPS